MSKDVDNGSGGDLFVLSSMSCFTCEQNSHIDKLLGKDKTKGFSTDAIIGGFTVVTPLCV